MYTNNFGYIDPGTGSMLFTIIIGIATTAVFMLRGLIIKLKLKLAGGKVSVNQEKTPLTIFSDNKRYWNVFKPICDELEKRKFATEYWTMSPDDPSLKEKYNYVKCVFIGSGNGAFAKLNMMKSNICLSTTPGLDVLQWKRSKDVDWYVHTFHDVTDGTGYRMFGLDCYNAVLLSGEVQEKPIRELEKLRALKEKELILTGSTYMDELKLKRETLNANGKAVKTDKVILCAPSWGESSILCRYGEKFIDALIKTGYKVIIRPHPQSKTSEADLLEKLQIIYPNNDRFEWNFDNDNFEVLNRADILISDFSGVIFDYCFIFDKPIICADTSFDSSPYDAAWLDRDMWLLRVAKELGKELSEDDFDNMKQIIDDVICDDRYAKAREEAKKIAWANEGKAAQKTADYIISVYEKIYKKN